MNKTLLYISLAAVFILGIVLGVWLRSLKKCPDVPPVVHTDTLWRYDTVTIDHPVPVYKRIHDTTYIAVTDTMLINRNDTTYIPVPRETTFYSDEEYQAWVTGFRATLDSIRVFPKTAIVEVPVYEKVKKPWGIGVQVGGTYLPKIGFTPYVGLGVSYNIFTF